MLDKLNQQILNARQPKPEKVDARPKRQRKDQLIHAEESPIRKESEERQPKAS